MKKIIKYLDEKFFNSTIEDYYHDNFRADYLKKKMFNILFNSNVNNLSLFKYWIFLFEIYKKNNLKSDIVEIGSGSGRSLSYILFNLLEDYEFFSKNKIKYHGFDSFEGYPKNINGEIKTFENKNNWSFSSEEYLNENLIKLNFDPKIISEFVKLYKGYFDKTLDKLETEQIGILHLDCNLYSSTILSLEKLYDKVEKGGLVVFDEYIGPEDIVKWPGASKAIDEYLGDDKKKIQKYKFLNKYFIIKE